MKSSFTFLKLDSKQLSWTIYDFANSSFATTVMAGFFPVFFKLYLSEGVDPAESTARLGTILAVSGICVAFFSPFLGALSDRFALKKVLLFLFMSLGILSAFSLGALSSGMWMWGALLYGLGQIGFNASITFYESLLPSVAEKNEMNYVSSMGYSFGYLGGGILFLLNVLCFVKFEALGFSSQVAAVKFGFLTVGLWWLLFSLPLFFRVKEERYGNERSLRETSLYKVFKESHAELLGTLRSLRQNSNLALFLLAYWLYIDGVYTIFTMAVDFGMSIGLQTQDLILALILTQFVGFPCAWLFGRLARDRKCRGFLFLCIFVYSVSVVFAKYMSKPIHFYSLAVVIGLVQGGIQALSRSLFARMIPEEKSGEYFGFFNLVGRFASIIGPALVSIWVSYTQDSRSALMSLLILFGLGAFLLALVKEPDLITESKDLQRENKK